MPNLYKVSCLRWLGYDTFDSFICAAVDEEQARNIHPANGSHGTNYLRNGWQEDDYTWVSRSEIGSLKVEHIGTTDHPPGTVIITSFNAG